MESEIDVWSGTPYRARDPRPMYSVHLEEHASRTCLEPPMLAGADASRRKRGNSSLATAA